MKKRKRLIGLLAFGLVATAASLCWIDFYVRRPVGDGPAGPSVAAKPFRETWTRRKVLLLGIGDSITAGLGAKSKQHSYFERLLANPDDEYADMRGKCLKKVLPNIEGRNLAQSGSTSLQHYDRIVGELEAYPADVYGIVVMTTGGNDIIHNYGRSPPREGAMYGASMHQAEPWIAAFDKRLDEMISIIEGAFPGGCEIYLADIYDPTDGVGDAPSVFLPHWQDGLAIHARYNAVLVQAAVDHSNVHHVPLWQNFLGHGSHCRQFWRSTYQASDPHYWFYDNIEDPNDRGYDAIRRIFLNEFLDHSSLR